MFFWLFGYATIVEKVTTIDALPNYGPGSSQVYASGKTRQDQKVKLVHSDLVQLKTERKL